MTGGFKTRREVAEAIFSGAAIPPVYTAVTRGITAWFTCCSAHWATTPKRPSISRWTTLTLDDAIATYESRDSTRIVGGEAGI